MNTSNKQEWKDIKMKPWKIKENNTKLRDLMKEKKDIQLTIYELDLKERKGFDIQYRKDCVKAIQDIQGDINKLKRKEVKE